MPSLEYIYICVLAFKSNFFIVWSIEKSVYIVQLAWKTKESKLSNSNGNFTASLLGLNFTLVLTFSRSQTSLRRSRMRENFDLGAHVKLFERNDSTRSRLWGLRLKIWLRNSITASDWIGFWLDLACAPRDIFSCVSPFRFTLVHESLGSGIAWNCAFIGH